MNFPLTKKQINLFPNLSVVGVLANVVVACSVRDTRRYSAVDRRSVTGQIATWPNKISSARDRVGKGEPEIINVFRKN